MSLRTQQNRQALRSCRCGGLYKVIVRMPSLTYASMHLLSPELSAKSVLCRKTHHHKELHEVVIDGNTLYYFSSKKITISILPWQRNRSLLAFAKPGDTFAITGVMSEGEVASTLESNSKHYCNATSPMNMGIVCSSFILTEPFTIICNALY